MTTNAKGGALDSLLRDLESGSDDDRSVAHACRVERDALATENARLREALSKCVRAMTVASESLDDWKDALNTARKALEERQ